MFCAYRWDSFAQHFDVPELRKRGRLQCASGYFIDHVLQVAQMYSFLEMVGNALALNRFRQLWFTDALLFTERIRIDHMGFAQGRGNGKSPIAAFAGALCDLRVQLQQQQQPEQEQQLRQYLHTSFLPNGRELPRWLFEDSLQFQAKVDEFLLRGRKQPGAPPGNRLKLTDPAKMTQHLSYLHQHVKVDVWRQAVAQLDVHTRDGLLQRLLYDENDAHSLAAHLEQVGANVWRQVVPLLTEQTRRRMMTTAATVQGLKRVENVPCEKVRRAASKS